MTTGARASYAYTLNRAGSRLTEASTISGDPGNGTATLGYDPLGRLTCYALPGIRKPLGRRWQEVPNRDQLTIDGTPAAQTFDAANRPTDWRLRLRRRRPDDRSPGGRRATSSGTAWDASSGSGPAGRHRGRDVHL